jgi:hypothetical protein
MARKSPASLANSACFYLMPDARAACPCFESFPAQGISNPLRIPVHIKNLSLRYIALDERDPSKVEAVATGE